MAKAFAADMTCLEKFYKNDDKGIANLYIDVVTGQEWQKFEVAPH